MQGLGGGMIAVYVAGPYTGDPWENTKAAIRMADHLSVAYEVAAFPPHLSHFWDVLRPHEYEFWMRYDLALIPRFDAVYRMPGVSPGADREVALAQAIGLPTFTDEGSFAKWVEIERGNL